MILSPMQNNYVTKEEFGEFKDEMLDFKTDTGIRFDNVDADIRNLRKFTWEGFVGMEKFILNSFIDFEDKFGKKMDEKFEKNRLAIISHVDKKMDEKFEKNKIDIIAHINKINLVK